MKRAILVAALATFLPASLPAGSRVVAQHAAVSSASPYSTQAAINVMRTGGNAVDAAVAAMFTMAVAHPHSGNLGGGGFLLFYDAREKEVWALDFLETAPAASPVDTEAAARNVSTPGTVAGLEEAHRKFGKTAWSSLLQPAISLAEHGFAVDRELARSLANAHASRGIGSLDTGGLFLPEGKPLAAGTSLKQPQLAAVLSKIAAGGAKEFYQGATAKLILTTIQKHGGKLSAADLSAYRPLWRAPIEIQNGEYALLTIPPPSAGGVAIAEMLAILNDYELGRLRFNSAAYIHLLLEAQKRADVDVTRYVGDPASTRIPYHELLSSEHARRWRETIDLTRATPRISLANLQPQSEHTTHISIVDTDGNIAALTTTLHNDFGSGIIVEGGGFFLNAAGSDFSAAVPPESASANRLLPGNRATSPMSPTIILKGGKPLLVLGSEGGSAIPSIVVHVFLGVSLFGKSLSEAVSAARFEQPPSGEDVIYEGPLVDPALLNQLNGLGHGVTSRESIGDVHAIMIDTRGLTAVADPRHGGAAGGF